MIMEITSLSNHRSPCLILVVMSPCLINLHQCFHDKVVSALEKRKTETNYQEGKVLIHNCLHSFHLQLSSLFSNLLPDP